jgi:carboxyl-terminal processing protease
MSGTQKLSGRTGLVFTIDSSAQEPDKPGGGGEGMGKFNGLIYHVVRNGPAANAGLQDGDYVIKIDGQDVIGTDAKHIIADVLPGTPGSQVKLTVKRGEQIFERSLVRGEITPDAVWIRDVGNGIYAIVVTEWRENVHNEIYSALTHLRDAGARGIILDLRHNGGGLWDEAVETSSYFVKNGTLVSIRKRVEDPDNAAEPHFTTQTWERRNGQLWLVSKDELSGKTDERHIMATLRVVGEDGKVKFSKQDLPFIENLPRIVVLGDHFSASASEVVIGALSLNHDEDARRNQGATLRGAPSYGKGIAQNVGPAPLGTSVSVTNGRYFLPDGSWPGDAYKHRNPIKPEKVVEQAPGALLYTPSDTQLSDAVDFIKSH